MTAPKRNWVRNGSEQNRTYDHYHCKVSQQTLRWTSRSRMCNPDFRETGASETMKPSIEQLEILYRSVCLVLTWHTCCLTFQVTKSFNHSHWAMTLWCPTEMVPSYQHVICQVKSHRILFILSPILIHSFIPCNKQNCQATMVTDILCRVNRPVLYVHSVGKYILIRSFLSP